MNYSTNDPRDMSAELGKWILEIDGEPAVTEFADGDDVTWAQRGTVAYMRLTNGGVRINIYDGMLLDTAEIIIARAKHVAKVKGWA